MTIVERIQKLLDGGNYIAGVDHNNLLNKLDYYGFRGVVKVSLLLRQPKTVCHTPWILFIYQANISWGATRICVKHSETCHFADDTNMLQWHSSPETLVKRMNLDLKNLSQWLKANKLSLNVRKTKLIIFHSSSKNTDHGLKFKLDGKILTQNDTIKYLCVLFLADQLLWSKQINYVATKLNQAIGILSKLKSRSSLL